MQWRRNKNIITPRIKRNLILIFLLLSSPYVLAEGNGEVELINPSTLRMSYDQEIRNISSVMAWAEDTPIQLWETDKDLIVEYEIINNNFFALTLTNSPTGREREYPIFYCVNNEIPDYDRYTYNNFYENCEGYKHVYKLRDIREGRKVNIKIPPLELNNLTGELENGFLWVVGDGAKGGGGLPVCEGWGVQILRNESTTPYNAKFKMQGRAYYSGSSTAGCTVSTLWWEQNYGSWATIPTTTPTPPTKPLSGDGVVMSRNSPAWLVWYSKYPKCEFSEGYSIQIRIKGYGTFNGRGTYRYSTVLTQTCEAEPTEPEPETEIKNTPIFILKKDHYYRKFLWWRFRW